MLSCNAMPISLVANTAVMGLEDKMQHTKTGFGDFKWI